MKKVFRIEELDCAHCAQKIEDAIRRLEGVQSVSINFIGQRLTIEAEDESFDRVMKMVIKTIRKAEPDCRVIM